MRHPGNSGNVGGRFWTLHLWCRDSVLYHCLIPLFWSYDMFAMFTNVHCFPVFQHSECEPLGLYIGLTHYRAFSLLGFYCLSTILRLHVLTSILMCPTSYIHHYRDSPYNYVISSWDPLSRWAPGFPLTYGASSMLGGSNHSATSLLSTSTILTYLNNSNPH